MTNYFEEAKSRLSMRDVLETYGIEINRSGMCLCPFHAEKTASCKVYEDSLHCFGCGEHHDIISFVKTYFDMESQLDALKKINEDFSLGFDFEQSDSVKKYEISEYVKRKNDREAYKEWEKEAWRILMDKFKLLQKFKADYAPKSPEEELDKRFVVACHNLDYAEYILDEFESTPFEERKNFQNAVNNAKEFLDIWENYDGGAVPNASESHRTILPTFHREREEINHSTLLKRRII